MQDTTVVLSRTGQAGCGTWRDRDGDRDPLLANLHQMLLMIFSELPLSTDCGLVG